MKDRQKKVEEWLENKIIGISLVWFLLGCVFITPIYELNLFYSYEGFVFIIILSLVASISIVFVAYLVRNNFKKFMESDSNSEGDK